MQRYPVQMLEWIIEATIGILIGKLVVENPTPTSVVILLVIILILLGIAFRKNIKSIYNSLRGQDEIKELNIKNKNLQSQIYQLALNLKDENEKLNKAINNIKNKLPFHEEQDKDIYTIQNVTAQLRELERLAKEFSTDLDAAERMRASKDKRMTEAFAEPEITVQQIKKIP